MASFAYLFERFPAPTQTFCYREVAEMCRKGVEPAIFSIRRPSEIPLDCPEEVIRLIRHLPEERTLRSEIGRLRAERRIGRKASKQLALNPKRDVLRIYEALWLGPRLREEGIRHVHAHFAGIAARTAYWLKKLYGISYSFTGHANDIFCETSFPVTQVDLIREAALVVTETDYSCDWLKKHYPQWAGKFHRVYNGIDSTQLLQAAPTPGRPHIISVGRCIEKKGFADLIDACALLRDRGVEFECSIVGSGPLEDSLRARVTERSLDGVVRLTGSQPQAEVRSLLSRSHVFALACSTEANGGMDNFPTVIVEAMGSRLPIVSTRLAGVPEMVQENVNGLLVNERDPAALAVAIETLLADPERASRFGAAGVNLVAEKFVVSVTTDSLINLLASLPQVQMPPPHPQRKASWLQWLREPIASFLTLATVADSSTMGA